MESTKQSNQGKFGVTCDFTFDGYDWRNAITVKSPSGKTIRLTANWGPNVSNEVKGIFTHLNDAWSCALYGIGGQKCQLGITRSTMEQLLKLSNKKS